MVKGLIDIIDLEFNILNAYLQILFRGKPFYWGLKYKPIVQQDRRLVILANGPSLHEDLERLRKEDLSKTDFAMMNFSANSNLVKEIQPKFYCLADHVFFRPVKIIDQVRQLYSRLEKDITWDMTLLLAYNVKVVKQFSGLTNPHIKFQRVYSLKSVGPKKFQRWVCQRGHAIPGLGTVTNLATFAGIQYGYRQIEFCGNDMSLLDGLCIDDDNHPCISDRHFYDKEPQKKPITIDDKTYHTLESYVDMVQKMIIAHNEIADYGKSLGVKFVNRTKNSMLDCYPRLVKICPDVF